MRKADKTYFKSVSQFLKRDRVPQ